MIRVKLDGETLCVKPPAAVAVPQASVVRLPALKECNLREVEMAVVDAVPPPAGREVMYASLRPANSVSHQDVPDEVRANLAVQPVTLLRRAV